MERQTFTKQGYTVNKPKTDSAFKEYKTPLTKIRQNLFSPIQMTKKAQLGNVYKRKCTGVFSEGTLFYSEQELCKVSSDTFITRGKLTIKEISRFWKD